MRCGRPTTLVVAGALVVGSLVAAIGMTEVAYRVARRFVCFESAPMLYTQRDWGWTHRPKISQEVHGCFGRKFEWRSLVTINSHGLRDREIPYEKPAGTQRVVLLGDSITEAIQVPFERTFAALVEERLRASGRAVEVVNGGHAGFGTDSELLFYRVEGRRYQPDLVVLAFNLQNDLMESFDRLYRRANAAIGSRLPPKPSFRLGADGSLHVEPVERPAPAAAVASSWWTTVAAHLYVARLLERALTAPTTLQPGRVAPVIYEAYAPWTDEWQEGWRLTTRLIAELQAEVARDGAGFAVVLFPSKDMADPASFKIAVDWFELPAATYDLGRPHRAMTDFLRAASIPFLDLVPILRERGAFFTLDVHLNETGHATVAPPMADFVARELSRRSP